MSNLRLKRIRTYGKLKHEVCGLKPWEYWTRHIIKHWEIQRQTVQQDVTHM